MTKLHSCLLSVWLAALAPAALLAPLQPRAQEPTPAAPPTAPSPKAEDEVARPSATSQDDDEHANFHHDDLVRIGNGATLASSDRVSDMVVVLGDAKVDGKVDRDLVVVFGDVELNGSVEHDTVVVFGSLKAGPKAKVGRDTVVIFGKLDEAPGAKFGRRPFQLNPGNVLARLKPLFRWVKEGLFLGRLIVPSSGWVWGVVGLCFLVYLGIAVLFPKPVETCVTVLQGRTLQSFFAGILGLMLSLPLFVILAASGIGLLVVPFLACGMAAAILVGRTASFQFVGLQVLRRFRPTAEGPSLLPFVTGSVLVCLLYMIPLLGIVVWGFLFTLGFGAALLAVFAAFRRNGGNGGARVLPQPVVGSPDVPAAPVDPNAAPGIPPVVGPATGAGLSSADYVVLPRAGFWLRLAASLLDFILLSWLIPLSGHLFLLCWLAYHVGMWVWKGTTVGGIVCGLKVVRLDGRVVDIAVALIRALAAVFSAVALCLGFFWAGWSRERQSWHDKIAGTVIVKVPRSVSLI